MLAGGVLALGNMHHCHYCYLLYLQSAYLCTFVLVVTAGANNLHENCYLNVNYYVSGIFNLVAGDYSDIGDYIYKLECNFHVTEQQPNSTETLETYTTALPTTSPPSPTTTMMSVPYSMNYNQDS